MSDNPIDLIPPCSRRTFLGKTGAAVLAAGIGGNLASSCGRWTETPELPSKTPLSTSKPLSGAGAYTALDPAKKIRIGVVGGGFGSSFQWHLDPNCVVQGVSDLDPQRRKHLQETYRSNRAYDTLDEMLKDPQMDAVAIFTGAPDHVKHSKAAMEKGKHVICAVPACMSLEEAEELREIKERTGLKYMMAETSWFNGHAIAARELHQQGAFGELFYSEVEYNHPMTDEERNSFWFRNGERTWRHGFVPMLYPTHATSYLVGTTGERLTDVSCLGLLAPQIEGYGVGKNQYDNPYNAMMGLFSTDQKHICRVNVIWTGTNAGERAQWFGTNLSFFMPNDVSGQPMKLAGPGAPEWQNLPAYDQRLPESMRVESGHGGSHTFLTHEFIAAIVEDREPAVNVYEALAMTVPGIVANESARKDGERLKIPSFDRTPKNA